MILFLNAPSISRFIGFVPFIMRSPFMFLLLGTGSKLRTLAYAWPVHHQLQPRAWTHSIHFNVHQTVTTKMLLNKKISISYFLGAIKYDLIAIVLYAVIIGLLDNYSMLKNFSIPLALTSVLGTAVALLLAFRTSQSYERWWEARIVWGAIVNESRTLIRQIKSFYVGDNQKAFVSNFVARQIKWCEILAQSLRKQKLSDQTAQYLQENNITGANLPNALLSAHSEEIKLAFAKNSLNQFQQIQMDNTIVNLCNAMGQCERIKNTVFPRSYSVLIHFIIYVFATVLPFGLTDDNIILEVFLCILVPSIFISIEKTAILMQDPFENHPLDTPMTTITRTIESNLKEMIGEPAPPATPFAPQEYYVL